MRVAVVEGVFCRVLDMLRRVEIRFADLEMNYVSALGFEFPRSRQRQEGGFGAKTVLS